MSKYETVNVKLSGTDGNAFAIMGTISKALRRAGASQDEIREYMEESMSGDYDKLLLTASKWVTIL